MPQFVSVSSSNVSSVAYESATSELLVVYGSSSRVYRYQGVPQQLYQQLLQASSKGKFLAKHVKGVYPFV